MIGSYFLYVPCVFPILKLKKATSYPRGQPVARNN